MSNVSCPSQMAPETKMEEILEPQLIYCTQFMLDAMCVKKPYNVDDLSLASCVLHSYSRYFSAFHLRFPYEEARLGRGHTVDFSGRKGSFAVLTDDPFRGKERIFQRFRKQGYRPTMIWWAWSV
jgi:hypothetical protein